MGRGGARPKLAIIGGPLVVIGVLIIFNTDIPSLHNASDSTGAIILLAGFIGLVAGLLLLAFSLSKRNQIRLSKGINKTYDIAKDLNTPKCMCCKCQNCDRRHNHWTHD
jgi:hypothetical protein